MDVDEHGLEAFQRKGREAVTQHVATERTIDADPMLQSRLL